MKNEKNFYDIINSKFADRQVSFEEADWNAMRTMIASSRAGKRRAVWLVASLSLLLCASGAFAYYNWNAENGKSNTVSTVSPIHNTAKQITSNGDKQITNSTIPVTASASHSNNTTNDPNNSNTINRAAIATNATNSVPINENTITTASTYNAASSNKKTLKSRKHVTKSDIRTGINNAVSSNTDNNNHPILTDQVATQQNNLLITKDYGITSATNSNTTSTIASSKASSKKETALVAKTTTKAPDSAITSDVLPPRFSDEPRVFRGKTNIFSVEAGAEYSGGWQLGNITQAQGFNPMIGLGFTHYLGSKFFLKTGLQFSTFGNMKSITYNYQHSVGNVIYDSVITTKRLYFLKVPIQAEYYIGHKSSVGIGGSVWYLLGNSGYATTYQQIDNNPPVNIVQYSQNASLNGYSKVNASAHILYRYSFSDKFSMYGMIYFELTNMKDNSFFGENIIERTHGFEFMVSYSLN